MRLTTLFVVMAALVLVSCRVGAPADPSARWVRYYDKPLGVSYEVPWDFAIKGSGPSADEGKELSTPTQLSSPSAATRIELQLFRAPSDDLRAMARQWMGPNAAENGHDVPVGTRSGYWVEGAFQDSDAAVVFIVPRPGQVLIAQILPRTSPRITGFQHLLDSMIFDT
ncbi:MAG: hypothetical protein KGK34_01480 [Chloroflexota bacterium]|nr:hypothetical protein [Chloroflexota bacterium]